MGIREENRARMLREIQVATLDLAEEQGLESTTVADIAARVGISERTVFRYYASKENALIPGQQGLADALMAAQSAHHTTSEILADLLAVCREHFAREVEHRDFRRISRLLIREPELLGAVARQERTLVESLSAALVSRDHLDHLQALLIAEIVAAAWRITWQVFARNEVSGFVSDPVELFDSTVRELEGLLPHRKR